jgi:diguanylate cyclase (GGDEF)-like protein/PAS domain S-box-containing protein
MSAPRRHTAVRLSADSNGSAAPDEDFAASSTAAPDRQTAAKGDLPGALIAVFDTDLRLILAAGHALGHRESSPSYREGEPLADSFPADIWRQIEPLCRSALRGETRSRSIVSADGSPRLMIDVGPLSPNGSGPAAGSGDSGAGGRPGAEAISSGVAVVVDISESLPDPGPGPGSAEDSGGDPRERFEEVFQRAPIGTGLIDQEGRWVLVNQALCDITGYTSEELVRRRFHDITHPDDLENDAALRERLLAGEISAYQIEKRYFNSARETMSALLSISLVRDHDDRPLHFIVQLQDISERKRLEEHLRHLADHDPLTGLRNRRLFEHDLKLQVGRCRRYDEQAALIVVDLDGFKQVNDIHGHRVGDEALKAVARMLTRRLRATDLVARLGGDEFAVLLPYMDPPGAELVAADLQRVIGACTVDTGETVVHLAASAGFAMLDRLTVDDASALDAADRAMYAAKRANTRVAPAA